MPTLPCTIATPFRLTNDHGDLLVVKNSVEQAHLQEPEPGSVVLVGGLHGVAWQRFFTDGQWHSVGRSGKVHDWPHMLGQRNLILIYDAPVRAFAQAGD